ncbi:MAG: YraN family protein [Pseudomonadota bacterium]
MMTTQKNKKQAAYQKGVWAERLAALYLMGKGYKILKRRYKTKVGEIDLIAQHGDTLVFIEVKARASTDDSLFSITERAKTRITNAAQHYLSENDLPLDQDMRFDVVAVGSDARSSSGSNGLFGVKHLDNAWLASA